VQAGAATGEGVDLSPAALAEAGRRAERAGLAERVRFVLGDAAGLSLEQHDWVILDRVICCYPDCSALIARAIASAGSLIAFTAPHTRGWRGLLARAELLVERIVDRVRTDPCPSFLHDLADVERSLEAAGFRSRHQSGWRSWRIAVYERAGA
ncbi:MAG TPA: hypothetical protein VFK38_04895, partial [Candidatus Limnocylindrales bacterium]|nr:hypothetical protein [Candidatus Limnocylindrales bacterium]